jgi:hypothetical protein
VSTPRARNRRDEYRSYYYANHAKRLEAARIYRGKNAAKIRADNLQWKLRNPEKTREYVRAGTIKHRYGLTRAQHAALYLAQNYRCAICGVEQTQGKRRFGVDHDHVTGKVRGLLCHYCNAMLGHGRDRIELLEAAIEYLKRHA